jgi:hypothetical protein
MAQFLFEDISRAIALALRERTKRITSTNMQALGLGIENFSNLRLFNNSIFECLEALTHLDPRLRGDDGGSHTFVIPAKAGI